MMAYSNIKSSGVSWFATMPAHWESMKIGSLFSQRKVKVSDKDYAPLSVTKNGIVPQLANAAKSNDRDNRKLVCAGDFVINSRSDRKGSCGVSELDGSVSLINTVLEPRQEWNNKYVHYLLRSQPFSEEFYRYGRGIVADLWTTRFSEMKEIILPVPPRDEQDQIVRFLDWKISSINQLINTKKKEIDRLKELRLCLITNAVLYGVSNEGTILKPRNDNRWEKVRIGYKAWIRARLGWRGLKATEYVDEGYPFLSAFNIVDDKLAWEDLNFINRYRYDESPEIKLSVGDILLVKDGAGIGKCARVDELPYGESTPNGSLALITPDSDLDYRYLYYYLISNDFKNSMNKIITGMGVPHLTQHFLKNVEIPCPPVEIQKRIADFLDAEIGMVDAFIINVKSSVEKLQEYRSRLISDVVTGQVDVRNIVVPEYEYVEECSDAGLDTDDESEDVSDEEV